MTRNCVVIGAGIMGVNVALRLAQKGLSVALVDASGPASGTTGTSGSLVGANEKRPWDYYRLGLMSMAAMRRLADELDHADWYLPTGHLEWADSDATRAALDTRVRQLEEWSYPVHRLSPAQVMRDLEPDLLVPPDVEEVTFFSDDSILYPHTLVALLLRRLRALGVTTHFGGGPATIDVGARGVEGVRTGEGARLAADVVVGCAGRWTETMLADLDVKLPMVTPWDETPEALGLQVITTGTAVDVRRMIRMPGVSIRPAGGGRLMLHGRPEEVALHSAGPESGLQWDRPLDPPPAQAHDLVEKARRVLPHMQSTRVQSATASVRALTQDGLPSVGWVEQVPGLYTVATHSGIGLGPLLGELVAEEVTGSPATVLDSFRPGRFTDDAWRSRPQPMRAAHAPNAPMN